MVAFKDFGIIELLESERIIFNVIQEIIVDGWCQHDISPFFVVHILSLCIFNTLTSSYSQLPLNVSTFYSFNNFILDFSGFIILFFKRLFFIVNIFLFKILGSLSFKIFIFLLIFYYFKLFFYVTSRPYLLTILGSQSFKSYHFSSGFSDIIFKYWA